MTAISISDANLEAIKNMCRELSLKMEKDINQREMEDKICEYIFARKEDFVNTMFASLASNASSANEEESTKKGKGNKNRGGK